MAAKWAGSAMKVTGLEIALFRRVPCAEHYVGVMDPTSRASHTQLTITYWMVAQVSSVARLM
jgi:hypothetical protein